MFVIGAQEARVRFAKQHSTSRCCAVYNMESTNIFSYVKKSGFIIHAIVFTKNKLIGLGQNVA